MSVTHDKIDAWLHAADELLAQLIAEQPAGGPDDDEPEAA